MDLSRLQNGTAYKLYLCRDDGTRLQKLDQVIAFQCQSGANSEGSFSLDLPGTFDRTLLGFDRRVIFWRKPVGGAYYIEFQGIICKMTTWMDAGGNKYRRIEGQGLERIISGRLIAYLTGTAQGTQTDQADDMCKVVARQNLGASATDTTRAISSAVFSVAADDAAGQSITKDMGYRKCLDTLREICDSSRQAGTEVYFRVISTSETQFEFRTFIGQPGHDLTGSGPIFSVENENLSLPVLVEDATNEVNRIYAMATGYAPVTAEDTTRSGRSLFGLREGFVSAGSGGSTAATAAANAAVIAGRPVNTFSANLLSVPGSVYGLDWNFGDKVPVSYDGRQFSATVRAATLAVGSDGKEALTTVCEAYL